MSSSQMLRYGQTALASASLAGMLVLGGCSLLHSNARTAQAAPPPPPVVQAESPADQTPQTDTDAVALSDDTATAQPADQPGTTTVLADAGSVLKATAPKSYVVKRGDTLWGIANLFLRNPWLWPEIWYVNPGIHNPHRIYPGDSVRLALATNGRTQLQIVRGQSVRGGLTATRLEPLLRSSALDTPIETIPYSVIAAFISHPAVLTEDQIRAAPYIVALAENHDVAGTGQQLYIEKLSAPAGARYSVMHVDEPLIDPDNGARLGYVAIYTGTAQITEPGKISKAVLTGSARETLQGDLLVPDVSGPMPDFVPHRPSHPISGQIIDVVDNVLLAGQNQVVVLNRGSNAGLERGNVLTVDQAATQVRDRCASIQNAPTCRHGIVTLPTDTAGTLLIFQVYPRVSYALILGDTVPIQVSDRVRSP
ncbi:MAG: LysM peptidoglycan-binding domain-containing protein [Steroidobacteraceae bacterium]